MMISTAPKQITYVATFVVATLLLLNITSKTLYSSIEEKFNEGDEIDSHDRGEHSPHAEQNSQGRRQLGGNPLFPTADSAIVSLPGLGLPGIVNQNIAEIVDGLQSDEIPFFWNVPMAGGGAVKHYYGICMGKTVAAQETVYEIDGDESFLSTFSSGALRYVNIETHTKDGIQKGKDLKLAQSGMADLVISPHFYQTVDMFDPSHKARLFALFRHPLHRIANIYHLQYGKDSTLSFEEFVNQPRFENNWMVRYLLNKEEGTLTGTDLELAKEIIRRKCVVGIFEQTRESIDRFDGYFFGWQGGDYKECRDNVVGTWMEKYKYPPLDIGSSTWNMLLEMNYWDMMLYNYAQILFAEQQALFSLHGHFNVS